MTKARTRAASQACIRVQARIKLARLLELHESAFESRVREIEADPLFRRLSEAGILSVEPMKHVRFAARALDGRHMRASDDSLGELLDGDSSFAKLMKKVGQERFEASFLGEAGLSDADRAAACGISQAEACSLREFMDRLYVRSEFDYAEDRSAPVTVYSSVAGITLEGGCPVLAFFNREVWKGRYRMDQERYLELKATLPPRQAAQMEQFMCQVNLLAFRQTTLHRVLEALIEAQSAYLKTGDPDQRVPLTQRAVAARLGVSPSVLNQLIANKSVELPWRFEIPLRALSTLR